MKKKALFFSVFALCLVFFLIYINIFMVVDVFSKKDYVYTSLGVGDSMYPYISNGDTIIVLTVDDPSFSVGVGDVVVYVRDDDLVVAHRIYDMSSSRFFVKGDNNLYPDSSSVGFSHIVGKVYGVIDGSNPLQRIVVEQFISI